MLNHLHQSINLERAPHLDQDLVPAQESQLIPRIITNKGSTRTKTKIKMTSHLLTRRQSHMQNKLPLLLCKALFTLQPVLHHRQKAPTYYPRYLLRHKTKVKEEQTILINRSLTRRQETP